MDSKKGQRWRVGVARCQTKWCLNPLRSSQVCQFFCVNGSGFVFGMGLPTICQLILKGSGPFS